MRIDPTKGIVESDFEVEATSTLPDTANDIAELIARIKRENNIVEKEAAPINYKDLLLDFDRITKRRQKEVISSTADSFVIRIERYGSDEEPIYSLGSEFVYKDTSTGKYLMGSVDEIWEHPDSIDYTIGQIINAHTPEEYVKMF